MKTLFNCLLVCCFLFVGFSPSFADGGTELMIVANKTSTVICTFDLPKGFTEKNSQIEIAITDDKNNLLYFTITSAMHIRLPGLTSGDYQISITVMGEVQTTKIKI